MSSVGVTSIRPNCLYFSVLPGPSGQYPGAPPLV
jgi:hypothetical protein